MAPVTAESTHLKTTVSPILLKYTDKESRAAMGLLVVEKHLLSRNSVTEDLAQTITDSLVIFLNKISLVIKVSDRT